ncbi:MAG TPA: hypothetical protein DCZ61_04975 [Lachnospiraceae bacterium]|nr:hypothetical protein [Lachnospiraceae bacterium]
MDSVWSIVSCRFFYFLFLFFLFCSFFPYLFFTGSLYLLFFRHPPGYSDAFFYSSCSISFWVCRRVQNSVTLCRQQSFLNSIRRSAESYQKYTPGTA